MWSTPEELRQLAEAVWATMIELPLYDPESGPEGPQLVSRVRFMGAWHGELAVSCPEPLARRVAAAMFATDPDEVSELDTRDALGEVANMIGGNLKVLMPEPTRMSLPLVDHPAPPPPAEGCFVDLQCEGHPVRFALSPSDGGDT